MTNNFGHSTVRPFLLGRGELSWIGWVAVSDGGNVNPTHVCGHQSHHVQRKESALWFAGSIHLLV